MLSLPSRSTRATLGFRRSFTLIELLVVMAIMAVVLGISVYQFRRGEVRQDLQAAADDMKAAWQEMQTRALAGTATPRGATRRIFINDTSYWDIPSGGRPASGYGLMLYGTRQDTSYPYSIFYPDDPPSTEEENDSGFLPGQQVIDQPFVMLGCAVIYSTRPSRCWVTLPEYSPVLPPNTYIDKDTIQLAPSSTSNVSSPNYEFTQFIVPVDQQHFRFRGPTNRAEMINFDTCRAETWPQYDWAHGPEFTYGIPPDVLMQRYLFLGIRAPQPTYYLNGTTGCEVLRFSLRSNLDQSMPEATRGKLWVQLDLRTGRVSTAPEESGLPNHS